MRWFSRFSPHAQAIQFLHKCTIDSFNERHTKASRQVKMARREKKSEQNSNWKTQQMRKFQLQAKLNANWLASELMKTNGVYRMKIDVQNKNSGFYSLTRPCEYL